MADSFSFEADIKQALPYLNRLAKKQIPYATSRALNDVAVKAYRQERAKIYQQLDRPKPYTVSGIRYQKSTKKDLIAGVYIKPIQSRYLRKQILGGMRRPRGGTALPVNFPLDEFGNIPGRRRGLIKKSLQFKARGRTKTGKRRKGKAHYQFVADIKGIIGIWDYRRDSRQLKLMARIQKTVKYKPRFKFFDNAERVGRKYFASFFYKHLENAIKTANR